MEWAMSDAYSLSFGFCVALRLALVLALVIAICINQKSAYMYCLCTLGNLSYYNVRSINISACLP